MTYVRGALTYEGSADSYDLPVRSYLGRKPSQAWRA